MSDILAYTEDQLRAMPKEDLAKILNIVKDNVALYHTRQLTEKTMMNALYGALANRWFPLFNEAMAAAITGNGRFFIQKLAMNIEDVLQSMFNSAKPYVIYNDTDSCYYTIEPFVNMYIQKNPGLDINEYVEWADQFEKKVIQPTIAKTIDDFAKSLNAYNKKVIGAKREIIADVAVFTAKKKYYARVRDDEGKRFPSDSPKIKVTGLEIIKSSTPLWSKKYLKEAIPHILDKDEDDLRDWIKNIKQTFIAVDPNQIAGVSTINNLDYDLTQKGVPIGSRSAICYNNFIKSEKLDNKYAPINPGDKCKRLFLVTPNKLNTNVVSYSNDSFVKELEGIIDYDTNFEKGFMKPLKLMVGVLNYNLDKQTENLDDW